MKACRYGFRSHSGEKEVVALDEIRANIRCNCCNHCNKLKCYISSEPESGEKIKMYCINIHLTVNKITFNWTNTAFALYCKWLLKKQKHQKKALNNNMFFSGTILWIC